MRDQHLRKTITEFLTTARDTHWEYDKVLERFQEVQATHYGDSMPKWVPDYEYSHGLMLDAMSFVMPENGGRVLDLGAGTGRFSRQILETFDSCHLTVSDFSDNMLSAMPNKLAEFDGRYGTIQGDFFDPAFDFPAGSFDCVASVFAVCHGRTRAAYANLYARIHRWLKPGGCFVCYDHVLGDRDLFTVINAAGWYEHIKPVFSAEDLREAIVGTYQEDAPRSLREHMDILMEVGYDSADVLYKKTIFGIYAALK